MLCIVLPAVAAVGVADAVRLVVHHIHDRPTQWAAIGAVVTGAAVLVALVGLPIAIVQLIFLRNEQKRIAAELEAQPLVIGFLPRGGDTDSVSDMAPVTRPSGPNDGVNAPLTVRVENTGTRSTLNPFFKLEVSADLELIGPMRGPSGRMSNSRTYIVDDRDALSPGAPWDIEFTISVPHTQSGFPVTCLFASRDASPIVKTLRVLPT